MRLPNAHRAYVDPAKVRDYLLAFDHPLGRHKAAVFAAAGFRRRAWPRLLTVLHEIAQADGAELVSDSRFGRKYLVRAIVHERGGRPLSLATVWMVRRDEDFPRFITAYPGTPG
jgi:hypothetical protein